MDVDCGNSYPYSDSNIRCLKCVFVVMEVFPKILQKLMSRPGLSGTWLHNHIQNDQHFKKQLTQTDHQMLQTLLTDGYTKLDLTLIFKIITHYSNMFINPPTRGWTSHPIPSEINIGDDAQRLRLKRNNFLHKVNIEMDIQEYVEFFSDLRSICERIDKFLNSTDEESFKIKVEKLETQPLIQLEDIRLKYDEERSLKEYFVEQIERNTFKVYKGKSMELFLQEIRENHEQLQGRFLPIDLVFPEISNSDLIRVMDDLKEDINKGLVNIKVDCFRDGSLVIKVKVLFVVLSNDADLQSELKTLFRLMLTTKKSENCFKLFLVINIVLTPDHFENESVIGTLVDYEETKYSQGQLQLHLSVNSDILQSDELFKSEMKTMFKTIVSKSNGNSVFPSDNTIVSVIEPGIQAPSSNDRTVSEDEMNYVQFLPEEKDKSSPKLLKSEKKSMFSDHLAESTLYSGDLKDDTKNIETSKSDDEIIRSNPRNREFDTSSKEFFKSNSKIQLDTVQDESIHSILSSDDCEADIMKPTSKDMHHKRTRDPYAGLEKMHNIYTTTIMGLRKTAQPLNEELLNLQLIGQFNFLSDHCSGCCTLPGLTVFADKKHRCIRMLDINGSFYTSVDIPTLCVDPDDYVDITTIYDTCIAIAFKNSKTILIIDVNKAELLDVFRTKYEPLSITFHHGNVLYCALHKGIIKLDIEREEDRSNDYAPIITKSERIDLMDKAISIFEEKAFISPKRQTPSDSAEYIICNDGSVSLITKISASKERISYCNFLDSSVTVLDSTYNVIFKFKDVKMFKRLSDITVDERGIIYVISFDFQNRNKRNILAISHDGKMVQQLQSEECKIINPNSVHFDPYTQQLIVIDCGRVLRYSVNLFQRLF